MKTQESRPNLHRSLSMPHRSFFKKERSDSFFSEPIQKQAKTDSFFGPDIQTKPSIEASVGSTPLIQRTPEGAFAALRLVAIQCLITDDHFRDHVYITANGSAVWGPVAMDTYEIQPINQEVAFSSDPLVIRVYDQETIGNDDLIGSVTIAKPTSEEEIRNAPSSAILAANGLYRLHFQVHRV